VFTLKFFFVLTMSVTILAITVAIFLKVYGETRWLLGIAMALVGCFTLFMGGVLVALLVAGDEEFDWKTISLQFAFLAGALATLRTTFQRFRQLGRQGHETMDQAQFPFTIDTHTPQDFTGEPALLPKNDRSDSD
jgi:hypothetical protein